MAPRTCQTNGVLRTRKTLLDSANVALIPLRPLSIGEVLDGAFLILQRNARSLLGIPLAVMFCLAVLVAANAALTWALADVTSSVASVILIVVQSLLLGLTLVGALLWVSGLQTRSAILTVMGEGFAPPVG